MNDIAWARYGEELLSKDWITVNDFRTRFLGLDKMSQGQIDDLKAEQLKESIILGKGGRGIGEYNNKTIVS